MERTYLFYDLETTGLNPAFDQVLEFAAIRTRLNLEEIERHEIKVALRKDVIPSPYALLTHKIGITQMQDGIDEYSAIQQIHRLMNTPGTISVGYNTLGFDDEFLRFSFYRHLLTPYTHQFAHQCGRMDLYPITVMYALFEKSALSWPIIDEKISLKLEHLSDANHLADGPAHSAIVDVLATVALAKKLKVSTQIWSYCCDYFNKQADQQRLSSLPKIFSVDSSEYQQAIVIDGKLGARTQFQSMCLALGQHQVYRNQSIWLRMDHSLFSAKDLDGFISQAWIIKKRAGEPPFILPPKDRFLSQFSLERKKLIEENLQFLKSNPHLFSAALSHFQNDTYETPENVDHQAALYIKDFSKPEDLKKHLAFHQAPPEKKESVLNTLSCPIEQNLGIRLMARHYPDYLSEAGMREYQTYVDKIFSESPPIDYRGKSATSSLYAMTEITQLLQDSNRSSTRQDITLLHDFQQYLAQYANQ